MRSLPFCELHSEAAHASGRTVNQNPLALVQPSLVEERLPCRQSHYRNGSGVDMVNRLWLERRFCFLDNDVLCISAFAAAGDIRASVNLITVLEFGDAGTHCFDNTRNIPTRNERQGNRKDILQ